MAKWSRGFRSKAGLLCAAVAIGWLASPWRGSLAVAGPGGNPILEGISSILGLLTDPAYGLREIKREVRTIETDVRTIGTTVASFDSKLAALRSPLELAVMIDEDFCASGASQCTNTGVPAPPARAGNASPVSVAILVTRNGAPVEGLTSGQIFATSSFGPAGGPSAVRCYEAGGGCAAPESLFQRDHNGIYHVFMRVNPVGALWKAGTYFGTVEVHDGAGERATAMFRFQIKP